MSQAGHNAGESPHPPRDYRRVEIAGCVALLIVAGWFLFADLGRSAYHDGDEALYATISTEMKRSGDWLTPRFWGEPFLHKPPLQYWFIALSYAILPGTDEFRARFPSAAAGLLLLGAVYWVTRRLGGPLAGALAALVLVTNVQFLFEHAARSAVFDSLLMLLTFGALVCGVLSRESRGSRIASAVLLSGVMLLKAPVALFPAVVVLAHLALSNRRAALSWLGWVSASAALLVLPWHVYQLVLHGRSFWDPYVVYEIFGRSGGAASFYTGERFVHLDAFWQSFLPWSPFIMAAVLWALAGLPSQPASERREREVLRSFAAYAMLFLVVLCFMPSKWPWHVLPAYPAMAVVFAVSLRRAFKGRWYLALPAGFAAIAAWRILLFDPNPLYAPAARSSYLWPGKTSLLWTAEEWPRWGEFALAAIVIAVGTAVPLVRRGRRIAGAAAVSAALFALAVTGVTLSKVPRRHESSMQKLAAELERRRSDEIFAVGFDHFEWYDDRMEPLASAYLLGVESAAVVDCDANAEFITPEPGRRSSVVVHRGVFENSSDREAVIKRFQKISSPFDVWLVDPEDPNGWKLVSGSGGIREPRR